MTKAMTESLLTEAERKNPQMWDCQYSLFKRKDKLIYQRHFYDRQPEGGLRIRYRSYETTSTFVKQIEFEGSLN